ncbi:hypothetical protein [Winogradskyella ursingii]|uniref:hypothetical protein n=1 Tax=Winogradskyella ursingii TaxID=2686079 RepID=UPI0015C705D6|nr:hypothetical protein [Winogradskyella ursingii]
MFRLLTAYVSCEKDIPLIEDQKENNLPDNKNIRVVPWSHFEVDNGEIAERIAPIRNNGLKSRDTITSNTYGFSIDDSKVQIIENDGYTTYTFFAFRDSVLPNILENYTYKAFDDGSYEQYLLGYHYTLDTDGYKIFDTMVLDIQVIQDNNLILGRTTGCTPKLVDVIEGETCVYNELCTGNSHSYGQQCDCTTAPSTCDPPRTIRCNDTFIWIYEEDLSCGDGAGPGDNSTNNNNSNNNGGGGTGGNTTNNNTDETTDATPMEDPAPEWQEIADCLNDVGILGDNNSTMLDHEVFEALGEILTPDEWRVFKSFLVRQNNCSVEAQQSVIDELLEILEVELMNQLEANPFLLLEIDCLQIENWQTLAQHTAPQSVLDKIENLPSSWANNFEIQPLDEANGTMVNLDYFSVNITTLPNNPDTNSQFTADGLLDYIRRNFNNFVEDTTFDPYCEIPSMCQTETDLWNSNNPLGSIIYIDIPIDEGVVVCTEYTNSYWYFMTMNAPYAGNHPVSGTRQFGYELNLDGSFSFFVRGVDRFDSNTVENGSYLIDWIFGDEEISNAFDGSDELWESFQSKINQFVDINDGDSTIIEATKNRPDWDKVQQVLMGELPISELGCND